MSEYRYVKDRRLEKGHVLRVRAEVAEMMLKDPDIVEVERPKSETAKRAAKSES